MGKMSELTKLKISIAKLGKKASNETKLKFSLARRGVNNPNYGNKMSQESKEKISLANSGKFGELSPKWKGGKKSCNGYILEYKPEHPYCKYGFYVYKHRLVMEEYLGRYLTIEERIHHINGIKDDNRIENLMLFKNESEHQKYHAQLKRQKINMEV
jgi:hypothetical protein